LKGPSDQYADLYPSGFDFLLTAIGVVVTAYSVGRAVSNDTVGYIFIVLALLGLWISFAFLRALRGTKLVAANGFMYAGVVALSFTASRWLCEFLPENPFKAQIAVCGSLCWMLVFGSFLIWSDQTLLFQAVPSIAIFGLVGCYDTYRNATWMFFVFLLTFAMLLARVHGRTMLRQAKESGYSQTGDRMDRSATELERMRSGPWRWAAGPQWALGSAFVVIFFSFIGAPLIRESVQGVTANVIVQAPSLGNVRVAPSSSGDSSISRVGRGPSEPSSLEALRVTLDEPRYLRTNIYQSYSPAGWSSLFSGSMGDDANRVLDRSVQRKAIAAISKRKTIEYQIEPLTSRVTVLPVPGEVMHVDPSQGVAVRQDATISINRPGSVDVFKGTSLVPDPSIVPKAAWADAPDIGVMMDTANIPASVLNLAQQVAPPGTSDFDRAEKLKAEIARRVKYNLNAAATPEGRDPVEYFLFESHEGYCDLFATSMVLMARSIGIPARYVTGYYPINGERDESGRFIIRDSERHAWAELLFRDAGWVVFDATEDAEAVPGGERGSFNQGGIGGTNLIERGVDVLIGIGVLTILFLSVRTLLRTRNRKPTRTDLDREYLRFAAILAKVSGKTRNFDQTPAEYVAAVGPMLNGAAAEAEDLTQRFERLFYSPAVPTAEDLQDLRARLTAFRAKARPR